MPRFIQRTNPHRLANVAQPMTAGTYGLNTSSRLYKFREGSTISGARGPIGRERSFRGFGSRGVVGMSENLALGVLIYLHVLSMSLWFGSLFGYVVIVWPAIMSEAEGEFPRAILARIAMRTAPWIYLGMSTALLSLVGVWAMDGLAAQRTWMVGYGALLAALAGNNVYGSIVAWPRIMLLPQNIARKEWFWFRVRMTVSLVVGLALYSAAIIATWERE
jgi:uncharacterized membrane protein